MEAHLAGGIDGNDLVAPVIIGENQLIASSPEYDPFDGTLFEQVQDLGPFEHGEHFASLLKGQIAGERFVVKALGQFHSFHVED